MTKSMADLVQETRRDMEDIQEFNNSTDTQKVIQTRLKNEYLTMAGYVKKLLDNGGYQGFANLVELKKHIPEAPNSIAKDMETKKVWLWDGVEWSDTGESELDQANAFTETLVIPVSQEQSSAEFHNNDDDPVNIPLILSDDKVLLAINKNGKVINAQGEPLGFEFYVNDEAVADFSYVDENGFVVNVGSSSADVDTSKMQLNEKDLAAGDLYLHNRSLKAANNYPSDLYEIPQTSGIFRNPTTIYAYLDQLTSENADYIIKTKLGEDDWGNEINQYVLTCPRLHRDKPDDWTSTKTKPPKIVLVSGTHGAEKEAVISSILFMHEIVNAWRQSDSLATLRYATDIVIVPLLCPSGYILNTRENGNKVNLNADTNSDTPQPETQISMQLPSLHPDAQFFIDHHNSYAFGEHERPFWLSFIDEKHLPMFKQLAYNASIYLRKEFDLYTQQEITAKLGLPVAHTQADYWTRVKGKSGILLETPRSGGNILSTQSRRKHNLHCLTELLITVRNYQINL